MLVIFWSGGISLALVTLACTWGIWVLFNQYRGERLLKDVPRFAPAEAIVILPKVDWTDPVAWIKPVCDFEDISVVVGYIKSKGKKFSIYSGPTFKDVERVMRDSVVREVYFVGHGGTHFYRLGTSEILCYCAFNDPVRYGKDFVHQVHCGTPYGKSLIEYVVPVANRAKCFFSPGKIKSEFIKKEFERLSVL